MIMKVVTASFHSYHNFVQESVELRMSVSFPKAELAGNCKCCRKDTLGYNFSSRSIWHPVLMKFGNDVFAV